MATKAQPKNNKNTPKATYLHMSPTRLAILLFVTLGFYELYWFYKNWQAVRDTTGEKLSPFWRAIFSGIWVWSLFPRIFKNRKGLALSLAGIYLSANLVSFLFSKLDERYSLFVAAAEFALVTVALMPLVMAQRTINATGSFKAAKRKLGGGETAIIIIGLLFMGLMVFMYAFPDTSTTMTIEQASLKTEVDDLTKKYDECSSSLSSQQAAINPSDKAAVDAYNKDFDACEMVRKQQNDAADKYNESVVR